MKKINKFVVRDHVSLEDLVAKKAQKFILGGYSGGCACNGSKGKHCCSNEQDCDTVCGDDCAYCCGPCALVFELSC